MSETWRIFYEKTKNRPPREILVRALASVAHRGTALDLGAGALNETRYLLGEGFAHVTAVDSAPMAAEIAATLAAPGFTYAISRFEELDFPEAEYDLVNALYALPFIAPADFDRVFRSMLGALRPGGVLCLILFGDHDEWASNPTMTFHTRAEAEGLLSGMTIVEFVEEDADGTTARGEPKHWHAFHIIAVTPGTSRA